METIRRAVEQAQEFSDVEAVLERHQDTASLPAAEREVQRRLKDASLNTGLRGQLIMLERLFAEQSTLDEPHQHLYHYLQQAEARREVRLGGG